MRTHAARSARGRRASRGRPSPTYVCMRTCARACMASRGRQPPTYACMRRRVCAPRGAAVGVSTGLRVRPVATPPRRRARGAAGRGAWGGAAHGERGHERPPHPPAATAPAAHGARSVAPRGTSPRGPVAPARALQPVRHRRPTWQPCRPAVHASGRRGRGVWRHRGGGRRERRLWRGREGRLAAAGRGVCGGSCSGGGGGVCRGGGRGERRQRPRRCRGRGAWGRGGAGTRRPLGRQPHRIATADGGRG